ncbi:homoserine kinase [Leuconostoc holzapfelii]|uniref:Homoserine kinase n=1 Tax=Leuconostoc holzapfelii TaxID=434464 RepID=A0A846ZHD2_9LACO|nr:homoserine kinase [Leuconostoc holzapfelii]NKZ18825.1 homoserine kinase [Leuconostoc holzapfelii]
MITIKVPATSANLGPGFDSMGVALQLYLTLEIHEKTATWVVDHDSGAAIPHDDTHFIVQAALQLAPDLSPHRLVVRSDIPLARGLGSSSSALLAGYAMANELANLALSRDELLALATRIEGHPDNVAPALFGGAVVAYYDGKHVFHAPLRLPKTHHFITYIPNTQLLTAAARAALPEQLPFKTSVAASAISNTLIAALQADDFETAKYLIEADQFHETARQHLVPHLKQVRTIAHELGLIGTYLSGAGPTIISVVPKQAAHHLQQALATAKLPGKILDLVPDNTGLMIEKEDRIYESF